MSAPWRWEAFDHEGTLRIVGDLPGVWREATPELAAEHGLALLLARVHPQYGRVAGWRVRVWSADGEGFADVDGWMESHAGTARVGW